ncbi:U-box domain-containing protein [Psidium guajava]|nr:U-box domain-containing protein [Psidium guajava]
MALMEETQKQYQVLMVAFASQGHMNPMLMLGTKLFSKGVIVKLATTEIAWHRMIKSFSAATDSAFGVKLPYYSDGLSIDFNRRIHLNRYLESLAKFGPPNLSNLIKRRYRDPGSADLLCIIVNPFVPWVADVAAEHGVPYPDMPGNAFEPPGLPLLGMQGLPSFVHPNDTFGSVEKLLYKAFLAIGMNKFKCALANSFYELERDVIGSMSELSPKRPVGLLVPPSMLGRV